MIGQTPWLDKSVQDFFSHCNWLGRPLETQNGSASGELLSLTLQVSEFFQAISWEGIPEVGALPVVQTPIGNVPNSEPADVTLDDLLSIF